MTGNGGWYLEAASDFQTTDSKKTGTLVLQLQGSAFAKNLNEY